MREGGGEEKSSNDGGNSMRPWDRRASRVGFREKRRGQNVLAADADVIGSAMEEGATEAGSRTVISRARARARYNVCRLRECHYVSFARVR